MNLENIGKDCPCYEVDCSDIMFDIGEFCGLPPNNGKLTIQVNGSTVGDFSANQQEDETINITTPTSQDIADAVDGEARLRAEADNTLQSNINAEELARQRADRDIQAVLDGESLARVNEDRNLQSQIDAIASKSDVVDVVGTYAELQAYDTSKLSDNDVVKVLDDSTHNDAMTYYRWNKTTQTWSYIGQESPYYSKSQMDVLLGQKQDNLTAGTGITLNGSTISADTTVLAEKSELSNYAEKSDTYTKTEVDNLVEPKLSVEVVEQLPVQGEQNKLYLTGKAHTTQTATGNPITATVTDGAGQIEDFQLDGDTFQQTYSGKNLFDRETYGTFVGWASQGEIKNYGNRAFYIQCRPGTTYTIQKMLAEPAERSRCQIFTTSDEPAVGVPVIGVLFSTNNATQATVTTQSGANYLCVVCYEVVADTITTIQEMADSIMIEEGATASPYEPYVGGIASPNPTYPQPIQVVTGSQTVAINGTNYPLDLGTIELCKLGTYQDYIYKDGDTWKVHKATDRFVFAEAIESGMSKQSLGFVYNATNNPLSGHTTTLGGFCSHFGVENTTTDWTGLNKVGISSSGALWFMTTNTPGGDTRSYSQFANWLSNNKVAIYYALATPTDTAITDTTLISQLNAIASASLENGSNTITNSATGSNLAGDMEVDYFGYDPTNRYDKWLWLNINNAYEKLGS